MEEQEHVLRLYAVKGKHIVTWPEYIRFKRLEFIPVLNVVAYFMPVTPVGTGEAKIRGL